MAETESPMAVEIPPKSVWSGTPIVVSNMQDVARDARAWEVYLTLNPLQKENFLIALGLDIIVPFSRVLEFSKPKTEPVLVPVIVTPHPESIVPFTKSAHDFKGWLVRQAKLVDENPGLKFHLGERYPLTDGTISVPIEIRRTGVKAQGTSFVFHYHPGVKGPSVGHGFASAGHFKPYDGAPKWIRVEQHEFSSIAGMLPRDALQAAKKK
jgi:hypothetical protein